MKVTDQFWNASLCDIKNGFVQNGNHYLCLLCGKKIEKGIIYPEDGILYEAGKYMQLHIEKAHKSVFEYLLAMDKKFTGLSDHQNSLLRLFYEGKTDSEIQNEMGIGSASTIRNHRFILKEKERQARIFLTLMELLKDRSENISLISTKGEDNSARDLSAISPGEKVKILRKYFPEGMEGRLSTFSAKDKYRKVILEAISRRFQPGKIYHEKEVNQILISVYDDHAVLRRYLVDYGLLDRKPDGSQYWLKNSSDMKGGDRNVNDRKKQLRQQYKEMKTNGGIYQIRNNINQKVFIVKTPNLKTINGKHIELQMGVHRNKKLQEEWNRFGEEAFVFEVLEVLEEKEEGFFDKGGELKKLEEKWLAKLQPYGEKGYN